MNRQRRAPDYAVSDICDVKGVCPTRNYPRLVQFSQQGQGPIPRVAGMPVAHDCANDPIRADSANDVVATVGNVKGTVLGQRETSAKAHVQRCLGRQTPIAGVAGLTVTREGRDYACRADTSYSPVHCVRDVQRTVAAERQRLWPIQHSVHGGTTVAPESAHPGVRKTWSSVAG